MKIHNKTQKNLQKGLCTLLCLLLLAASGMPVSAAGEKSQAADADASQDNTDDADRIQAPYFLILNENSAGADSTVDCFPLKATSVTTNISGVIAETYVVQTYTNEGTTPISARYVFPTSSKTTVHGMKMQIGNQIVTAQIKEKEEAKTEFETAKSEGKSASLLEQKRPNVFTMDVANIMPGDTACIELHYTELITPVEGIYEFIFPTVTGPRYAGASQTDTANGSAGADSDGSSSSESAASSDSSSDSESAASFNGSSDSESAASSDDSSGSDDGWLSSPYLLEGATPPGEYSITVNLSTGVPITEISCKSHQITVEKDGESKAAVTLSDPEDYAGNRDFILKYKLIGDSVQSGLVLTSTANEQTGASDNYFMLMVQPPERFTVDDIPPREYIFVLDVSGSMWGYPLDTAKDLLKSLVLGLRDTDSFNLVLFSDDTILLSPESLPATADSIQSATDLIDEEKRGGGTSMLPALKKAVDIPSGTDAARSIIVITDGYISNELEIFDLINENMDSASFFSFGIGSSVNDYLINGIAQSGMGEAFIVTDKADADDCAARFRTYVESPLLTDITIDYDGFEVYDVEPSTPSILYASRPIVLFGKWNGTPSGTITVTGKTGDQNYVQEIPLNDVAVEEDNEAVRYLWARTRLDRLAGYGSVRNDSSAKEAITQIGLEYSMTTPYTSFIAVIDTVRNETGDSQDVNQPLPLPLNVSNLAIGGGYSAYSEPGDIMLLLAAACVPVLMLRKRRRRSIR